MGAPGSEVENPTLDFKMGASQEHPNPGLACSSYGELELLTLSFNGAGPGWV